MMRGGGGGPFGQHAIEETLTRADATKVLRRLRELLRPYRGQIALAALILVSQTACLLAGPALVRYGIDNGLSEGDGSALNHAALLYLAIAFVGAFLARAVIRMVAQVGETFLRDLRIRVFRHLLSLGLDFFEREKTGRLVSRMTSDIEALQELVSIGLVMFVQNLLIFAGAIVAIFLLSWQLALFTLFVVPPVIIASRWFRRRSNRAYLEVRDAIGQNLSTLQEGLAGVRVVQAFAREGAVTRRFRGTNEAQYDAHLETVRISARYFPFVEFSGVAGTALIIGVGGWFVNEDIITVGTVAAFVLYLNNLFEPVQQLSQLYNLVQQSGAALQKLFELLDTRTSIAEKPGAVDLPEFGPLQVEHVTFGYGDNAPVLHDVSLPVMPGERVALVGPTGAGKSTLAKLIARFYDPREGRVRWGGTDLRDVTLRSLRERIVVVPQEGFLFAGTVRENVRFGWPDASDEQVDDAIEALGLTARFEALTDGLDTEVRERGSRLSAGERQLVSLCRAALADPTLLVLDEATSNLDPGTEREVERALEFLMEDRTVVVIAHRLSTAERADRIAVVDDGRISELGTHDELLRREGRYASLYSAWMAAPAAEQTRVTLRVTRILFAIVAVVAGPVGIIMLIAPDETDRYFSWPLGPPPAAAIVGGFYVASAVVFGWAALRAEWAEARPLCFGVLALTIPTLVATLYHEEVFDFGRWQALAWVGLFVAAPISYGAILVAQRHEPATTGATLATWARVVTAALGLLFTVYAVQIWREDVTEFPYALIGLSGRFIGCWCAFLATLATYVAVRNEWSRPPLLGLVAYPLGALAAVLRSYDDLNQDGRAGYLIALFVLAAAGGAVLLAGRDRVSAPSPFR